MAQTAAQDHRWIALAGWGISSFIPMVIPGYSVWLAERGGTEYYRSVSHLDAVVELGWFLGAVLAGLALLLMAIAARRSYIPRAAVLIGWVSHAAAFASGCWVAMRVHLVADALDLEVRATMYIALVGLAVSAAFGFWLWRIAVVAAQRSAAELARVNRQQRALEGVAFDPEGEPEEDQVPRL